jgi:hypothetical protein
MRNQPVLCRLPPVLPALFVLAASIALASPALAKVHLRIAANSMIVDSFNLWNVATPWESITSYGSPQANRPTVDLVLELQALKAGGLDFDFELVPTPNYERAKLEVIEGHADLTAETIWDDELAANAATLAKSDVILRNGDFEKGIYTLPTNTKLLSIHSIEELREYVGITVGTWALDLKALEAMQLKGVEKAPKAEAVFAMIAKQRADFSPMEFSSRPDMSNEMGGVRLVPVPNCKIALAGSRSWGIGRSSPAAGEIEEALRKGVAIMRADGRIERAFKESGFFSPRVADWKRLN